MTFGGSAKHNCAACTHAGVKGTPSIELPHQEAEYVTHIALDIGGSLVKLVYFSPDQHDSGELSSAGPEGSESCGSSVSELNNCSDSNGHGNHSSSRGSANGKGGKHSRMLAACRC